MTSARILARASCRADLAGGTLDLWPLYLFHPGGVTVNLALTIMTECEIRTHRAPHIILRSRDTPDTYIVYARFKDEASFEHHQTTAFHERLVPPILATVAGEMDLKFYEFVA